jgi:hypothetical protein
MRTMIATLVGLALLCAGTTGCGQAYKDDPMLLVRQLHELDVYAEVTGTYGTGHVGGVAFNASGNNGNYFVKMGTDPAVQYLMKTLSKLHPELFTPGETTTLPPQD